MPKMPAKIRITQSFFNKKIFLKLIITKYKWKYFDLLIALKKNCDEILNR
jgi:hypothetical protein